MARKTPEKYTLEFLSKEFHKHMTVKETTTGFNLPLALKTIVDEIIAMKKACPKDLTQI